MEKTPEISWMSLIVPGVVAGLFTLISQGIIAYIFWDKMKKIETQYASDLKSLESVLTRGVEEYKSSLAINLEKYKNELNDKSVARHLKVEKLEELHGKISAYRYACANLTDEIFTLADKEFTIEEYKSFFIKSFH